LNQVEISDKDRNHPRLAEVSAVPVRRTLIVGSNGQLGKALRARFGDASHIEYATRETIDLTDPELGSRRRWQDYDTIINAAAFTAVDAAETRSGRQDAWSANVHGTAGLARIASAHDITLVHVSSDYVFDGSKAEPYTETDSFAPLGVYGQTKAAADAIVATVPRHYILRTSWVIGDGANFVRTMVKLAERSVAPRVVADQFGRLTFASTIAEAISHLLDSGADYGTYNVTNGGEPMSWYDVARTVFSLSGHDPERVAPTTTDEYFANAEAPVAPRPTNSVLTLDKLIATGMRVDDAVDSLRRYLDV
jgi:dTDP-4-dehydrorhamnose 3,5-epimerase